MNRAHELLVRALKNQRTDSVYVQSRVKSLGSFKEKIAKNGYVRPDEVEDLVGLRLIGYLLSDYNGLFEVVKQNFDIVEDRHVSKPSGYQGRHLIVTFNKERTRLVEYNPFQNVKFEIQICTILEHALNEIEHDRGYKGELPIELQDRFKLLAEDLHKIDKQFQRIAKESIAYQKTLSGKQLQKIPIDMVFTITFRRYPKTQTRIWFGA
jgi:GTP pyrophosphokinase